MLKLVCRRQAAKSKREAQFQQRVASLRDAQAFHNDAQRVEGAKEEIAFAASKLLEAPEENLSQLRFLLELGLDDNVEVPRCLHTTLSRVSGVHDTTLIAATEGDLGCLGPGAVDQGLGSAARRCRGWRCSR